MTDRELMQQVLEALERYQVKRQDFDRFADEITALRERLSQPDQGPVAWVPVTKAMPESGVKVLACYRNRFGNLRRIRAQWIAAKTDEAYGEGAEFCSEYDEATDTYYTTEGWYECINNWDEYTSVAVTEGDVTHWMPLPPDPDTAPTPRRPLTDEEHEDLMRGRSTLDYGRAVEAAHGITGETK